METLDRILGVLEFVLIPGSLLWLYLDSARLRSILGVGFVALTLAQPFGIVATRQSGPPPADATILKPSGVHIARLAGVPVMPFVIYRREDLFTGFADNGPTATLRARSWFWPPILTNSTNISDICGGGSPCWRPGDSNSIGGQLGLAEKGDDLWLTLTNAVGAGSSVWKLTPGIASPLGLAYWILAAVLIVGLRRRASEATEPTRIADR